MSRKAIAVRCFFNNNDDDDKDNKDNDGKCAQGDDHGQHNDDDGDDESDDDGGRDSKSKQPKYCGGLVLAYLRHSLSLQMPREVHLLLRKGP